MNKVDYAGAAFIIGVPLYHRAQSTVVIGKDNYVALGTPRAPKLNGHKDGEALEFKNGVLALACIDDAQRIGFDELRKVAHLIPAFIDENSPKSGGVLMSLLVTCVYVDVQRFSQSATYQLRLPTLDVAARPPPEAT